MVEITHKNLIYFGYDGGILNTKTRNDSISWTFTPVSRKVGTLQEECIETAKLVAEKATLLNRTPVILLSGGSDSQVVAKSFLEANIDFETISFKYSTGMLDYETFYIDRFVQRNNLKHRYINKDWVSWLKTKEAEELYLSSNTVYVTEVPHLSILNLVWEEGGFPIMGSGDPDFVRYGSEWKYARSEAVGTAYYKHCINQNIESCIGFFVYTPEIALSFLQEKSFIDMIYGADKNSALLHGGRPLKIKTFRKYWPDIEYQHKISHFLRYENLYRGIVKSYKNQHSLSYNEKWETNAIDFINHLRGQAYN